MKRIFLFFFLIFSILSADYLYLNKNRCVKDFYYKKGRLYYMYSSEDKYRSTSYKKQQFLPGYFYDDENKTCRIDNTALKLGITSVQYYFLMGLSGLLLSFLVVFGFIFAFIK